MLNTETTQIENVSKTATVTQTITNAEGMEVLNHVGTFSANHNTNNPYPTFCCNVRADSGVDKAEILTEYNEFIKGTLIELGLVVSN